MKKLTREKVKVEPLCEGSKGSDFDGIEKIPDSMLGIILNGPTVMGIKKDVFRGLVRQLYAALQDFETRQAVPAEPLTLEQLRQMDGEPVYIVYSRFPEENEWKVLKCIDEEPDNDGDIGVHFSDDEWENLEGYGQGWLAYTRKPEGHAS